MYSRNFRFFKWKSLQEKEVLSRRDSAPLKGCGFPCVPKLWECRGSSWPAAYYCSLTWPKFGHVRFWKRKKWIFFSTYFFILKLKFYFFIFLFFWKKKFWHRPFSRSIGDNTGERAWNGPSPVPNPFYGTVQ